MADHAHPVEVKSGFPERISTADFIWAMAELVSPGYDADTTGGSVSRDNLAAVDYAEAGAKVAGWL